MRKKALVTGITGQDGSYMAELLLSLGYEVHGMVRRLSTPNVSRIGDFMDKVTLHYADMADAGAINAVIKDVMPDEVYNFAAMSQVRVSYDVPAYTLDITGVGFARLLEAVRANCPETKIYQACSSEMFGKVQETPQKETTPFYPRSPYGVAKLATYYLAKAYREGYGMNVYTGILFNHESPRRGEEFLSKKVVKAAVRIKKGLQDRLVLGNLDAKRDWGYAKEYMEWVYAIMQGEPDDYVIATGETHSVQEFVEEVFKQLDMDWKEHVDFDDDLKRPAEVDLLQGDFSKSKKKLGFEPQTKFKDLIKIMVGAELSEYD